MGDALAAQFANSRAKVMERLYDKMEMTYQYVFPVLAGEVFIRGLYYHIIENV